MWDRVQHEAQLDSDIDRLMGMCELQDERASLRYRVLVEGREADRAALRRLDTQFMADITRWTERKRTEPLYEWPAHTKRWWSAVRSLPHASLWDEADWRYAMDTALVHATFVNGNTRVLEELRRRERVMGTTMDSRRDLRIRYVQPVDETDLTSANVTAMAAYRKILEPENT